MKKIIIIGAGGLGREVAWLIERINSVNPEWELLGFIDDNLSIQNTSINGYMVLGTMSEVAKYKDAFFVCAIGNSKVRKMLTKKLSNAKFATLIDPTVEKSNLVEIGNGSILMLHSTITTNIKIGRHVVINPNCTIGHDAILEDYVILYPGVNVSGNTYYGECVEIGTGSQIIQGKRIGRGTVVGAGSVVISDLPEECTAVGVPAKPIKFHM